MAVDQADGQDPASHPWIAKASEPDSMAGALGLVSDPQSLALMINVLTEGLADSQRACKALVGQIQEIQGHLLTVGERLQAIETKLDDQARINEAIREALVDKIEPRLKTVEERPGGLPAPGEN
jgi:hypothetical protein